MTGHQAKLAKVPSNVCAQGSVTWWSGPGQDLIFISIFCSSTNLEGHAKIPSSVKVQLKFLLQIFCPAKFK